MQVCRKLTLITGSVGTCNALKVQLEEYIPTCVTIQAYPLDGISKPPSDFGDVVLFSSSLVKRELEEDWNCMIPKGVQIIIADRTINYEFIDRIVLLSPKTKVLFVSDAKESAEEGIRALKEVGIDHLDLYPYYPGLSNCEKSKITKDTDIAITPGEKDKVLDHIRKVYDIGPRLLDFPTIFKLLRAVGQLETRARHFSIKYIQKIIILAKKLSHSTNYISELNHHLTTVIDGIEDGLVVFDSRGIISVHNEKFRKMLDIPALNLRGVKISELIYNKKLVEFLMNHRLDDELTLDINSDKVLVSKFKLTDNDHIVARFLSHKNSVEYKEKENIKQGHFAKYTFENIVGESSLMNQTKNIAKKLAKTELTILLHGESGTGKELFASAIHNSSPMGDAPFLAVNFSSLSDDLIESELFGYEPGAFTGASKKGKLGLFEQAEGGTIFLDEIGDSSLKVQAKLLRVLQEKEVMRIGDTKIRPVNVRIIAATNQDLKMLMKQGQFRKDLYYRLKMGYMKIPPLRQRKEDISELFNQLIDTETTEKITVDKEVILALQNYDWPGNVRELRNLVSYMLALRDCNHLTIDDVPSWGYFEEGPKIEEQEEINLKDALSDSELFILQCIYDLKEENKTAGRKILSELSKQSSIYLTEGKIRTILDRLEKKGYILKSKGSGSVLTKKGKKVIDGNQG
ncbi:sigma 54-interacting transcriptional regulator [Proteinivorax hydrogeniformans]|uniref:Sigma 54-interacting transcriptional regulator n=1 Tax=Proteinivorax hydrogeniformans TaxID=1826727 RepID=A0AAU8HQQ0_9FIRM